MNGPSVFPSLLQFPISKEERGRLFFLLLLWSWEGAAHRLSSLFFPSLFSLSSAYLIRESWQDREGSRSSFSQCNSSTKTKERERKKVYTFRHFHCKVDDARCPWQKSPLPSFSSENCREQCLIKLVCVCSLAQRLSRFRWRSKTFSLTFFPVHS